MTINKQEPINFINESGCLIDIKDLEQAILWYADRPVAKTKKIFMHGEYPAVAIQKEKIHVHRLLMMYWSSRKLKSTEYVHHKNECKLDARKSNLEIMNQREHQSFHNKGKYLSEQHRNKISEAGRRRAGKVQFKLKRNIPLDIMFDLLRRGKTVNFIAKSLGVDRSTIVTRINRYPHLLTEGEAK